MKASTISTGLLLLIGAVAGGCATTQALHTESSSAAIRSAEDQGAMNVPVASLYLQYAKEELQSAADLYANGDKAEANSFLLRAKADAELAIALAKADSEKNEAQLAIDRVRQLQNENPYAPEGVK